MLSQTARRPSPTTRYRAVSGWIQTLDHGRPCAPHLPSVPFCLVVRFLRTGRCNRFFQVPQNPPSQLPGQFKISVVHFLHAMAEDFFKVIPRRLCGMVPVQLQHCGSMTIAQLGSTAARAIVMPPIAMLNKMKCDLQCLDIARQAEPVHVEAGDPLSPMLPLAERMNTVFFPVAIAIAIGDDEVGHESRKHGSCLNINRSSVGTARHSVPFVYTCS